MLNQGPAVGPRYNTTQYKTTLHAGCKNRAEYWTHHDDVIKWKHFPHYWPFVRGIHRWPMNSPHKGQWRGSLMFSLICVWINGWLNNGEAGDLRRHRVHYDVTVMQSHLSTTHTRGPHMRFLWWALSKKMPRNCYNDCTHGTTHQIISFPSANCESYTKPILEPVSYHVYIWHVSA